MATGTHNPATGTIDPAPVEVSSYDYGLQSGKGNLFYRGQHIQAQPEDLTKTVQPGTMIVTEASFSSYNTNEGFNKLLADLKSAGIELQYIPNRAVKNHKAECGIKHKDYDDNASIEGHQQDAEIIHKIAIEFPSRLRKFIPREGAGKEKSKRHKEAEATRERLHKYMNELRYDRRPRVDKKGKTLKTSWNWFPAKVWFRENGWKGDIKAHALAAYAVARFVLSENPAAGRHEFDHLLGWYDHAYPSMARGHAMHYLPKAVKGRGTHEARKQYLRDIRKEARMIFAKVKGTPHPATGTTDPLTLAN